MFASKKYKIKRKLKKKSITSQIKTRESKQKKKFKNNGKETTEKILIRSGQRKSNKRFY